MPDARDAQLRAAMFEHLDRLLQASPDGALSSAAINRFTFDGRPVRLIVQTGIWKPAGLAAALTIRTTFTPPNQPPPYVDDVGDEVLVRYKYRGTDPNLSDNRALRAAMIQGLPLAYVVGVARGVYSNTSFEGKLASGYNLSTAPVRFVTGELGWICAWSGVAGAYSLWRTTDGGSVWQSVSIPGV